MSAALLASPLVPLASAQTGGSGGTTTEDNAPSEGERVLAGDAILRYGDTGAAVAAVQQKLTVDDDGIFGPITEGAVKAFQGRMGIPVTGEVDSRTWTELFRTVVSFVPEGSPEAKAIQASVSGDAAVAEPEARAAQVKAPEPKPAADEVEPRDPSPASAGEHEHEPKKPVSKDDDAKADEDDAPKEPKAQKGGARPKAGIDKSSKVPEPKIEVSDKVVVSGDGSCATGKMGTPVKGTVTGTFGEDRGSHRHGGLDIAAPSGTAVRAALCGTVTQAGVQGAYGNIVCIRHTAAFSTCYAHLSSFDTRAGQYVTVGQLIGRVGSTGRSTGPHLHFETRINGRAHDPEPYLRDERRVPGTGEKPSSAQRASASSSSSSSSSGETRRASTQESQPSGTGGGTPPNGVAYEESQQQSASASQSPEPQQAPAQEPAAQSEPAAQPEPAPAEEQAPAQEQRASEAPSQEPAAEEPAPAEVAVTQAVEVAPQAAVTTDAPESPAAPVEEAVAPVAPAAPVDEEAVAPVVEEAVAPVAEEAVAPMVEEAVAEVVAETPAAPVAPPAG